MSSSAQPQPGVFRVAAPPMLAVTVVLLVVTPRYGPHWDELYFRMLPLDWWYVDQPPLTVWLARAAAQLSDDIWVQRLPAVAAAAAGALVAAMVPRTVGAGPTAQRLAAWAHAFTVYPLIMGHIFTTSTIDLLAWQVVILLVLRATMGHRASLPWAGVVAGLACWNKLLIVFLLGALAVSLLLTQARLLRSRTTWAGALIFAVIAAPQLIVQAVHGFPMAQVSAGLVEQQGTLVRFVLIPALALFAGPPLLRVWVTGLTDPWRDNRGPGRFLLPTVILLVAWTLSSPSQPYYPVPAILAALSLGWASRRVRAAWGPRRSRGIVAANSIVAVILCLPVLPASGPWLQAQSTLNPTIRDQVGWDRYAAQVLELRRPGEAVVAGHYAVAGAVEFHTPRDADVVYSGHNGLWELGPPGTDRVLLVGEQATRHADLFNQCSDVGALDVPGPAHPALEDQPIMRCQGPVDDWDALWPRFRRVSG